MTTLDRLGQDVGNIITRLAQDDPTWNRFLSMSPAYRYFHHKGSQDRYIWTTQTVKHNNAERYASGIYKYIKTKDILKLTHSKYHARRKDAKARALTLYEQSK